MEEPVGISTQVTLDRALAAHSAWKHKLQQAAAKGDHLDAATIKRDDCCDLGKWLHSSGRAQYGHFPEFQHLMDTHKEFHVVTGIVASMINNKDSETAKGMLAGSSQFSYSSMEVGLAINALKKAASS